MNKFRTGDRVKVISNCRTQNRCGTVLRYVEMYGYKRVEVQLDHSGIQAYFESSLEYIGRTIQDETNCLLIKEETQMAIKGNYKVALCNHVCGMNTTKDYGFALFETEEPIYPGDRVLCDTANGYEVCKIKEIISQDVYASSGKPPVTREVICPVDFKAFESRIEARKQRELLKKKMDKLVKDNQELILYQAIADRSPEMAALLDQYKALGEM